MLDIAHGLLKREQEEGRTVSIGVKQAGYRLFERVFSGLTHRKEQ